MLACTVRRAENYNHWPYRVVILVTLEVRNVFNSTRWIVILMAREHTFHVPVYLLRMIYSYLKDCVSALGNAGGQTMNSCHVCSWS